MYIRKTKMEPQYTMLTGEKIHQVRFNCTDSLFQDFKTAMRKKKYHTVAECMRAYMRKVISEAATDENI